MINVQSYKSLINEDDFLNKITYPVYHVFFVAESDYKKTFKLRFFVQKISDKTITETDELIYNKISPSLYVKGTINWYLTGLRYNSYKNNNLYELGVHEKNQSQVLTLSKKMPGLEKIIVDYTLFYRAI